MVILCGVLAGTGYAFNFQSLFQTIPKEQNLTVAFLDIGQGDAIYIEAPNGHQMLIDGGPKENIVQKIKEVMPYGDTSIDVLVITNPDADHISGFAYILKNYTVGTVIEPGTTNPSKTYQTIENLIKEKNIPRLIASKGMKVSLDEEKNISFDVLFPDRDVSGWDRNDGSIVGKLSYGTTSVMLMGDATTTTENAVMLRTDKEVLKSTLLKLGHHGSHTSSGIAWLEAVSPEIAIISAGKNNSYGHPHPEVLYSLKKVGIPYLGTYDRGTIIFESTGLAFTQK